MKTFIKIGCAAVLAILAFGACKKNMRALDLRISPVSTLTSPADQDNIQIQPQTGGNIVFKWDAATTPDSGLILYEVAFAKADGDFSNPIYKVVSDNSGVQTQATITQKVLNKIAAAAGIAASSSGKIKWAVLASKAATSTVSSETRTLTLERPAGFAELPDSLYITGTATEAGDDITKAIPLKKTSDGVFELYTSLKDGTYQLTDKASDNGTKYYVDGNGMIQKGDQQTTISGPAKAYRLNYDFNVATADSVSIQSIGLYQSANDKEIGQLAYAGNSTWEIDSLPVEFVQFSWGRDDRYKFIMHTSAGPEYWGSQNANNVAPAGQPDSYFYMVPVTNAQWDNTFKFDPAADGHEVNVQVFFQASGPYTHKLTYLN